MKTILQIYINSFKGLSHSAWMLAVVMLINRTGTMVLPFMGIYMTKELGFSIEEVGIVLACFGFGAIVGSWLGGWLTDKIGNFWVQAGSLTLATPLFFIAPQFTTVTSLSVLIFVLSVITESFRPANSVSVARYANPKNITRAFSLNRMAINLGFSLGPAAGGLLATISYNWIFYGNALASLIAACVFISIFYNKKPNQQDLKSSLKEEAPSKSIKNPYLDLQFIFFNVLCCLFAIWFFQLFSTIPLFYQEVHQLSEPQIGLILGFSGIIIVILEMLLVHVAEKRFTYAETIFWGTVLCAISFLILLIPTGYWILYLSIFIFSLAEILALPFMASVVVKRASIAKQGAYMGLNSLAFSAAHVFSPFMGTQIVSKFGFNTLWTLGFISLILVGIGFLWIIQKMAKS